MLTLVTYAPALNLPSPSPFGIKAETLLKMSGLSYEKKFGDPRKAPMGKLPLLKDGDETIADTARIQTHLENRHSVDFDSHLNAEEFSRAHALRRMIENHLYFCMVHFRWTENSDLIRDAFFHSIPAPMRRIIFKMILKKVKGDLHSQGISRHSRADIISFACNDIDAVVAALGDKPYMMGDRPASIDAVVYAFFKTIIEETIVSPLKDHALEFAALKKYIANMEASFES